MPESSKDPMKVISRREIKDALLELGNLEKDGFYSIPKITWWFLTFEDLAQYCRENWRNDSCFGDLPCSCVLNSPEYRFKHVCDSLMEVIELHEYESYFEKELAQLEIVRDDYPALIQWLKKNEKLGKDTFLLFWIDWWDEDNRFINPQASGWEGHNLKFRPEEWKNSIQFCEAFNELYLSSDVCTD
ncbi:hypothetical protein [Salegentibacter mishustinae]|uniref:hypothetical protein n=1 Tax=Salegentibacter mishustinae TaxID=270918 RepID=UPI00249285CA|nr:hypothetical protein [Salegentibacter mishustinae]